eukprot:7381052-Alexandrium_andersonii.AAC.1
MLDRPSLSSSHGTNRSFLRTFPNATLKTRCGAQSTDSVASPRGGLGMDDGCARACSAWPAPKAEKPARLSAVSKTTTKSRRAASSASTKASAVCWSAIAQAAPPPRDRLASDGQAILQSALLRN